MDFVHSRAAELFADCDLEDSDQEEIELPDMEWSEDLYDVIAVGILLGLSSEKDKPREV